MSWWRVIRLRRLDFLISWKTAGKQVVVYDSELTILRCSCASNLYWIWPIQSTDVYFQDHTRTSTIHHVSRCDRRVSYFWSIFYIQSIRAIFWAIDKLWGIQSEQIFFDSQLFMQYWMYACPTLCLRLSQSHDRPHDDFTISVGAQHQWFPELQLILDDLQEIRLRVNYDLGWIHHTIHTIQIALVCQNVLSTYKLKNAKLYVSWQIATLKFV